MNISSTRPAPAHRISKVSTPIFWGEQTDVGSPGTPIEAFKDRVELIRGKHDDGRRLGGLHPYGGSADPETVVVNAEAAVKYAGKFDIFAKEPETLSDLLPAVKRYEEHHEEGVVSAAGLLRSAKTRKRNHLAVGLGATALGLGLGVALLDKPFVGPLLMFGGTVASFATVMIAGSESYALDARGAESFLKTRQKELADASALKETLEAWEEFLPDTKN